MEYKHLINRQIRSPRVMLLDQTGEKIGDYSFLEALKKAEEQELDLMQVGQKDNIAICKILNYESFLYHQKKKKDKEDFKNRAHDLKSIQLRPATDDHDFDLKMKQTKEFLQKDHKVKIVVKLKNREGTMKEQLDALITKILDSTSEIGELDSKITTSPKEINFIMKPAKKLTPKMK